MKAYFLIIFCLLLGMGCKDSPKTIYEPRNADKEVAVFAGHSFTPDAAIKHSEPFFQRVEFMGYDANLKPLILFNRNSAFKKVLIPEGFAYEAYDSLFCNQIGEFYVRVEGKHARLNRLMPDTLVITSHTPGSIVQLNQAITVKWKPAKQSRYYFFTIGDRHVVTPNNVVEFPPGAFQGYQKIRMDLYAVNGPLPNESTPYDPGQAFEIRSYFYTHTYLELSTTLHGDNPSSSVTEIEECHPPLWEQLRRIR